VFPLPEGASVHFLEMRIGERRIVSIVEERNKAKQTYTSARRQGKKAALLELERPNLFTTSVANINPDEKVEVTLEYVEELRYDAGRFRLVFPLTFTPRYLPRPLLPCAGSLAGAAHEGIPADAASVPRAASTGTAANPGREELLGLDPGDDRSRITPPFAAPRGEAVPRAKIQVTLTPGLPVEAIESSSHTVQVDRQGESWIVTSPAETIRADCDFVLQWTAARGSEPRTAAFLEEGREGSFALVMIVPPRPDEFTDRDPGLPTETLFVVDVSGSMDGPSIAQAREALLAALDRQEAGDRFNLLAFNQSSFPFRDDFVDARGPELDEARRWVRGLRADGGTEIHPALTRALSMTRGEDARRVRRIVFLTDGAVGNEPRVLATIRGELHGTRLHTLGIGSAPNRYLMREMARFGRGICDFVRGDDPVVNRIDEFFTRIDRPVMSELSLEWEGVEEEEVYPSPLPDLHQGEPLFVSARMPAGAAVSRVTLRGRLPSGVVRTPALGLGRASEGSGVGIRWARAKIGSLLDGLLEGAEPDRIRAEVIDLAKDFRLVTRYTSLVAVEEIVSAEGPSLRASVPNVLPRGSRLPGGELPRGGTHDPLKRLLGILAAIAGGLLVLATRTGRVS
jgi:Ca-activated chloride channel family protein